MSTPKFADTHNLVAFLEKPKESNGFEEIIDFLNASSVQYALTVNPTIYTTCIEQFWTSAKVKTVNGEREIQAIVDKKKVIISKTSIRSDLKLDDVEGTDCLPTATIFVELERMGAKTTSWNEFSSTMASAIICLARNQKFNLSKYIFDNMVKNLNGGVKFLMYLGFVQVFLDKQVEGMSKHKGIYVTPSHAKKVFANMKRPCKGFSGRVTPLFSTMMVKAIEDIETTPEKNSRVLALETTKSNQALEIESLKRRVKSLEKRRKSRTPGFKRLRKVGSASRVCVLEEQEIKFEKVVEEPIVSVAATTKSIPVSVAEVVTTASTNVEIPNEFTLAQTLIKIKTTKPKLVTTAATTVTSVRPRAKGIIFHDQVEQKKDQVALDEEMARNLEAQLQAELIEEERLARQKEEEA
ncbi:hypothetical protein Tco_0870539, partial [Tanacetum coccineum]